MLFDSKETEDYYNVMMNCFHGHMNIGKNVILTREDVDRAVDWFSRCTGEPFTVKGPDITEVRHEAFYEVP